MPLELTPDEVEALNLWIACDEPPAIIKYSRHREPFYSMVAKVKKEIEDAKNKTKPTPI